MIGHKPFKTSHPAKKYKRKEKKTMNTQTKLLLTVLLLATGAHTQMTQLECLKSWNYARQYPGNIMARINNRLRTLDVNTPHYNKVKKCLAETVEDLKSQAPVPLLEEDVGMDLAAYTQSKDMLDNIMKLTHIGSDNSHVVDRLNRFGTFKANYKYYEMVAYFKQTKPVPADAVVDLLITDCTRKTRIHRKIIFETQAKKFGCGIAYSNMKTYITLIAGIGYTRNAVKNKALDQARIQGQGMYKGPGRSFPYAKWRSDDEFIHKGPQIHTLWKIEGAVIKRGPLGTLKDDYSVACPNFINPKILGIRIVHKWFLTRKTCNRKKAPWNNALYVKKTMPFAQKGKCYHRLSFCGPHGKVYAQDRQYKTYLRWFRETHPKAKSILGAKLKDDMSVKCPSFINPSLRKRIVQDWYQLGKRCKPGKKGFDEHGFFRISPLAKDGKCYQRLKYCSHHGIVFFKDSEYITYAEWKIKENAAKKDQ